MGQRISNEAIVNFDIHYTLTVLTSLKMHIYIYIYIYARTHTRTHTHTHTHIYIYIYIYPCWRHDMMMICTYMSVSGYQYVWGVICGGLYIYVYIYLRLLGILQKTSSLKGTKIWSTAALSWFNMERILSIFFVLLAVATVYGQFNPPVDVVQLCRKVANRMGSHYIRHPRNCSLFYNCDGDLSFPVLLSCQYPLVFSQSQQVCVYGNGLYDDCKKEVFLGGFGEYLSKLFDL